MHLLDGHWQDAVAHIVNMLANQVYTTCDTASTFAVNTKAGLASCVVHGGLTELTQSASSCDQKIVSGRCMAYTWRADNKLWRAAIYVNESVRQCSIPRLLLLYITRVCTKPWNQFGERKLTVWKHTKHTRTFAIDLLQAVNNWDAVLLHPALRTYSVPAPLIY